MQSGETFLRTSLRALSHPMLCCFLSVLAHTRLLVMFLHCMLQTLVQHGEYSCEVKMALGSIFQKKVNDAMFMEPITEEEIQYLINNAKKLNIFSSKLQSVKQYDICSS